MNIVEKELMDVNGDELFTVEFYNLKFIPMRQKIKNIVGRMLCSQVDIDCFEWMLKLLQIPQIRIVTKLTEQASGIRSSHHE